jgi:LuxR family transcriptional regulator, maltose regulon positive regulatory protein
MAGRRQISERRELSSLTILRCSRTCHLHLIMATRSDLPLPLARWRSRRQLSEVRAADLRFTHPRRGISSTR